MWNRLHELSWSNRPRWGCKDWLGIQCFDGKWWDWRSPSAWIMPIQFLPELIGIVFCMVIMYVILGLGLLVGVFTCRMYWTLEQTCEVMGTVIGWFTEPGQT